MEAKMLLRDAKIFPSENILKRALGERSYEVLESFITSITSDEYSLTVEWKYYNDGKAWLGKIIYKKKTVLWLSVWEGFFKTSLYFTEKHLEAISELEISEIIKDDFAKSKTIGRLIPMIFNVSQNEQLDDLLTVVRFKKSLK
ncbi:MAG: DUF3788 family protein [Dysgonomonas sp.]